MRDKSFRGTQPPVQPATRESTFADLPATLRGFLIVAVTSLGSSLSPVAWSQSPSGPEEARLKQIVEHLAAPDLGGRSGEGGEKAASYLADQFRGLKLEPLFEKEFVQPIPGKEPGTVQGRNVGARLRGSDPVLRDQWVIVSAHFDHLGVRGGRLYPGADDNASGVAMMLEVARTLVQSPNPPKRSVMFVGFDLEEIGLFGSRFFVAHPPEPLDKVVLFVTADMIARSLAGVCPSHVFVIGSEHTPELRPWIEKASRGQPLTVGLLGADLLVLNRSDYGPFRSRGIPFLFFTTGENPRYHTPDDTPDTLDFAKLTAISRMIHQVVVSALDAPSVPRWRAAPDHPFSEAVTIRDVMQILLKHSEQLKIGGPQRFLIKNTLGSLKGIVDRGAITPDERSRVIQAARIVLFTVL